MSSDRNRGPRASKPKSKSSPEENPSSGIHKDLDSTPSFQLDQFNRPDFVVDYEQAKFFVIKSFSEDNVHKSIKYSVWSSTPLGNRKLDAAYREAKELNSSCPVFLLFSVCFLSHCFCCLYLMPKCMILGFTQHMSLKKKFTCWRRIDSSHNSG